MKRPQRNPDRPETAILIAWLRLLHGWDQAELAKRAGLDKSQISDYELGQKPRPENLEKIFAAVNLPAAWARSLLPVIRHYREQMSSERPRMETGSDAAEFVTAAVVEHLKVLGPALLAGLGEPIEPPPPSPEEQRRLAGERFERLSGRTPEERRVLVDRSPRFRDWAMVERLRDASREAAAHSPEEAEEWADLAERAVRAGESEPN